MNLFWVSIISLSVALLQGCGSKKNGAKKTQAENYQTDTAHVSSDTIPKPTPPPPGLPPGQAKVKGEIITIHKQKENSKVGNLTLKVNRVLGYGSSTPPIVSNDSIQIRSSNLDQKEIQIGKIVSAVISYRLMLNDSNSTPCWTLVKIEKYPN